MDAGSRSPPLSSQLHQCLHQLARTFQPLLRRFPVAHDDELHVGPQLGLVALPGDPFNERTRIGECIATEPDDGALGARIHALDIGGTAQELDLNDRKEMIDLVRQGAKSVAKFRTKAIDGLLIVEVGETTVEAKAHLQVLDIALGNEHRGPDIKLR